MRKLCTLTFLLVFVTAVGVFAQSTVNYAFSTNNNGSLAQDINGNAIDMTTGTTTLIGPGLNSAASAATPIGFDFWLMGVRHTTFNATSHGLIGLTTLINTGNNVGGGTSPRIGAFTNGTSGTNMATSATGRVHYKVTGTAPSRVLVVEWLNMSINSTSINADATFQVRLYEATGAVELIYGAMNVTAGGPFTTVRAGIATSTTANTLSTVNFATHTTSTAAGTDNTVNNGVIAALNSTADGSRRYYRFVPSFANTPTGINFTSVSASAMVVNWTDNATDEIGYAVYRSDDGGTTYNFQTLTAANATSFVASGLLASTNYFWRVQAVREFPGAALQGSQTTLAAAPVTTTGSGLWSAPATWSTGVVPTTLDAVTIGTGHTVTIDIAAFAYSLAINGILEFEQTTARALTIGESVTINPSGTFRSNLAGTVTTHTATIGRNLTNNGILDFSTNTNTAGAGILFNTTLDGIFALGAGTTTDVRSVTMNKGTTQTPQMVFTPNGTFTVQGANTAGFLGLGTGGTFEIGGTNAFSNPVFLTAGYSIPAACGFRLNNPNATVVGQTASCTTTGLLQVSQGIFNIGTAIDNSMDFASGSRIIVDGGTVNATGRFGVGTATNAITYIQSAGTVTVSTLGNTSTTAAGFDLGTAITSNVNISGGSVVVQIASTAASGPRDYRMQSAQGANSFTGGTLQIGNAASGAAKTFNVVGVANNLVVSSTSANHTCVYGAPSGFSNAARNVTIQNGATLNLGSSIFLVSGSTFTNNGTLNGSTAGARLYWLGGGSAQTYTGTGTVTALLQSFDVDNPLGVTIDPSVNNVEVARIIMFRGNITNTNKLTLGNGGTSSGIIQYGNTTTPTAAGNFDASPVFNIGSGGLNVFYLRESNPRSTGFEINPTRTLNNMTVDNNINALTVAGGPIAIGGILTLTNGRVNTSVANLITVTNTVVGSVVGGNANSYINGPFDRTLPASLATGSTYNFPVGKTNFGAFELVNPTTNAGGTVVVRAEMFEANSGGTPGTGLSALNANRYWNANFTSGAANFTNSTVRVTDITVPLAGGNRLGQSATQTGAYNNVGNAISGATIASSAPLTTLDFFNIGLSSQVLPGGTYTVGTSAPTYQKLTQVAAALGSGVVTGDIVFEMLPDYDGTTGETFPINFVPLSTSGGNWKVTIRPQAGVTNRITSGDPGTGNALVVLNGIDALTFDGRPGGVGTTSEWLFRNTRTTATVGSVFVLQNDATSDTLQYLKIEGQSTATAQALVLFGTSTLTAGNSNNVLRANDIRDRSDVAGVPHTLVASSGTAAAPNNNNRLIANTLRNFTTNGLSVTANSNNWTVGGTTAAEGNNVFQEAARTTAFNHINLATGNNHLIGFNNIYQTAGVNTGGAVNCILVTGSGTGHVIRNNSIGGSNANRTGTSLLLNTGSTINGISVTVGGTPAAEIYNNTIANFGNGFLTSTLGIANGILINGGTVNVGSLGGNTIGGAVVTGVASDTLVTSYDNGWINVQGGTCVVENNLITNGSYHRSANDRNAGITIGAGSGHIIRNNTIRAIRGNNQVALPSAFTLAGIFCSVAGTSIQGNTIDDIQNFNTSFAGPNALGINWTATSGSILRNRITNVNATGALAGTSAPFTYGIYFSTGNPVIANNQIALGAGSGNETRVAGIVSAGTTNPGAVISYNTVYLSGTNSAGANNSYGILRTSTSGNTYFNNILYNQRTGGTGRHYAIGNITATPATNFTAASANYNLYITADATSVGEWGTTLPTNRDFAQWKTSSLADTSSYNETSFNVPAASLFINAATGNLNINPANAQSWYANGKAIAGTASGNVNNDFAGDTRGTTVGIPTDIGSDEFTPNAGVLPPDATASAAPSVASVTSYTFGGRKIGEIVWGPSGTVPSAISWKYYSGVSPIPGAINTHHDVQATGGSGYTYNFTQYYTLAEQNQLIDAVLQGIKRDVPAPWQNLGGSFATDATGKFVTSTGLTGFSLFSLAPIGVIPIKLEYFRGSKQGSSHVLDWKVVPVNTLNGTFTLERSSDGRSFSSLYSITASAIRMQQPFNYSTSDLLKGTNYYRLKMTDDNGAVTYSGIVALLNSSKGFELVNMTPNPVTEGRFKLNISAAEQLKVEVVVTDMTGRIVSRQTNNLISGFNAIEVNVSNLSNGMYQVMGIIEGERTKALKFVKQ